MSDVPNDEAAQMNSLPIQEELPGSNVETVANPIQIEVIDHELLEEREQFLDEDPVLTTELFRVKQWRLWRIAEYKSHMSRAGREMEKEELFALSWIGTDDIAEALLLSTITQAYSNKVQAKLAGSKGKLSVMEDNFQALSFVDFEEIDQANLHEGIQRSLLDFQHHPGATSSAQPESTPMQGEGQINEGELVDMCVNDKQVTIPESSNMQVMEPVASHIDETANEDILEEPVMIPGHSHAMVQIVESVEGLGRIPAIVERPIIETEEILGGCETNQIPAEVEGEELATVPVEVEELATYLATVPVEVQGQAEATILATVSSTVQVEEQATVLATVDNPLEVNFEVIENQDSLIEADIQISENLMDVQVEFPDEIQDNLEEEHALSTKRRKLVISETFETSEPENDDDLNMEVPTEEEGQMQLVTVPIQQKQAEFDKGILDLKKGLSSGNNEDEDNRLSSLFLKVDECQEEISTKFAKVIELKGDIREAHENIFKQLTSLNDQQKDITKVLKYSAEKNEKKWDEKASKLVTALHKFTVEQNKGLLNVIHQQQNQIIDLHNELSSLRRENAATSAKVNNIEAKVTKIDGNVDLLVDYAKKGGREQSFGSKSLICSHRKLNGKREEQPKYTLNNAPPLIKKQPKKDQVAWVANQNRILEEELKKGPEVPRRKMIYLSDEVNMMKELINYTGHEGKHLDGGRSFSECIKWFREGVLSGDSIQEAYGNYLSGQVQAKYKNAKFEGNFRDLRDHINRRIEEEAKGKKKS
nr:CTTNBP2 N-terminal-like protein [Ipomoea batatas]